MDKEKNSLVIVESPAKAKTIGKYLGPGFSVSASMGHLRDLPKSKLGVDVDNGFVPLYEPVKDRENIIKELKSAAKKSSKVYLATDPDREGEAISWHLKELLSLSDDKAFRVTFNEITKNAVTHSIKNPRAIDSDLVNAQQARRILDRIVGYKLSPMLWKKIRRGLSAGRVQSVATRMVADRENEIREFISEEYWLLGAILEHVENPAKFKAAFIGNLQKKMELGSGEEVAKVVEAVRKDTFTVHKVKRSEKKRSPSPPFITSTLQQEASRRMGMTPRRAMMIAQQLYEGVDVKGEGTIGLITYMRTDSVRISAEAQKDAQTYITAKFGEEYYPGTPNYFKSKSGAQDAHEAIRPSDVNITPERIAGKVTSDQLKIYRLIWNRFVASQMASALYDSVTVDAVSAGYVFRANHTAVIFPGFTAVYEESGDDEKEEKLSPLPDLKEGQQLNLIDITQEQKFTLPPPRYTEATLIRAMEESGVGRPSTYAPTISTILDREYVVKEGKHLRTTALGEVVTGYMKDRFADIVDLRFTARMEELLDSIEKGKDDWRNVLAGFYDGLKGSLDSAEQDTERIKIPDEVSEEVCDDCGKQMVVKSGRFGRFLACPGYPDCTFTKPLVIEMPGKCPKCGLRILKRTSKKGYTYYACEKLKECGFLTWDVPVADNCADCGQTMFKTSGRGFRKPFCINEKCISFLPEDKRGYRKKPEETSEPAEGGEAGGAGESGKSAEGVVSAESAKEAEGGGTDAPAKAPAKAAKKTTKKPSAAKKTTKSTSAAKKTTKAEGTAKKATKTTAKKTKADKT